MFCHQAAQSYLKCLVCFESILSPWKRLRYQAGVGCFGLLRLRARGVGVGGDGRTARRELGDRSPGSDAWPPLNSAKPLQLSEPQRPRL